MLAFQVVLVEKTPPADAGEIRDAGSIPRSGRSPGGENSNPLQYSCLGNPIFQIPCFQILLETEEPGGLQSMGSQRIRQNWCDWVRKKTQDAREVGGGWTDITAFSGTCQQTEYLSALTAAHPWPHLSAFSSDSVPPERLIRFFSGQLLRTERIQTELFLLIPTSPNLGRESSVGSPSAFLFLCLDSGKPSPPPIPVILIEGCGLSDTVQIPLEEKLIYPQFGYRPQSAFWLSPSGAVLIIWSQSDLLPSHADVSSFCFLPSQAQLNCLKP